MPGPAPAPVAILPLTGIPEVVAGDDVAELITDAGVQLQAGDIVVVAQKIISKAEGMLRQLSDVVPGGEALQLAAKLGRDPRLIELVLQETEHVVRDERFLIVHTKHGYVCVNAGIDRSNIPGDDSVLLLPADSDASAARLRLRILELTGADIAVIISDTFGRPWRTGLVNVALGVSGMPALIDYAGKLDDHGRALQVSTIACADELASAAELVMKKTSRVPAAVIRGYVASGEPGSGRELLRSRDDDMFRLY